MALCFTASSAVHAWEFVCDLLAVISSISHFFSELVSVVARQVVVHFRATRISV
jgi:hypothetical protein